jgi:hypothetical protein
MNLDILNKVLFSMDYTFGDLLFVNLGAFLIAGIILAFVYNLTRR